MRPQQQQQQQDDELGDAADAAVHRVASLAKAFGGDVAGDYAWRAAAGRCGGAAEWLEVRVAPEALHHFLAVLRLDCLVHAPAPPHPAAPAAAAQCLAVSAAVVLPGAPEPRALRLRAVGAPRRLWRMQPPSAAFDVDLVAMDSDRTYLRGTTPALRHVPADRLDLVLARVRAGRFCALDSAAPGLAGAAMADAARRAHAMLTDPARPWHMDDALAGRAAWVAARWARLRLDPGSVRVASLLTATAAALAGPAVAPLAAAAAAHAPPGAHDACALCQERFEPEDVVVNLACNHNFHAFCGDGAHGLCAWMAAAGAAAPTCPCCRAPAR